MGRMPLSQFLMPGRPFEELTMGSVARTVGRDFPILLKLLSKFTATSVRAARFSLTVLFVLHCSAGTENVVAQTASKAADSAYTLQEADAFPAAFFSGPLPRSKSVADDASLNDVCSVGQFLWAVGERGVVLSSTDQGLSWRTRTLPFECSLSSVCFLTNSIGFIGGTVFDPFARIHHGIVLSTTDGGDTWAIESGPNQNTVVLESSGRTQPVLPPISQLQFFDLENAVAVCSARLANFNAQVLKTNDGGATWEAVESDVGRSRWTSGAFLSPDEGVVVGQGRSFGAVVSDQVVTLSRPQLNLRRVSDASIARNRHAWIVGDAAMLLHSENGGVSWKPPVGKLPKGLADVFDFRSVDQRQDHVCIVGSPGNMIFTSVQHGQEWSACNVKSSAPLNCVKFIDDTTLVAVGEFGVIHRSSNAGKTWTTVRNENYRAAVLCLSTNPEDASLRLLASVSGDQGFRSVVVQPSGRFIEGRINDGLTDSINSAVVQAGAAAYECDWMFARNQPMHNRVRDELLGSWERQTDGRAGELLPARLAQIIRTWRPDVVCVETSGPDDQLNQLLLQALQPAIQMAADESANSRVATLNTINLHPWRVARVYTRLSGSQTSPIDFAEDELLSNTGTTIGLLADYCGRQVVTFDSASPEVSSHSYQAWNGGKSVATPAFLMAGIPSDPQAANRRTIYPNPNSDRSSLQQLIQRQNVEQSAITGQSKSTATPLAVIASLKTIGADLPQTLAMKQLQYLANLYAEKENLDGEIEVLKEIVTRFPTMPASADAAEKLFQYYSSSELRMLRRRESHDATAGSTGSPGRIPGVLAGGGSIQQTSAGTENRLLRQPVVRSGAGTALWNNNGSANDAVDEKWDRNAELALTALRRLSSTRADSPRILIRQAANVLRTDTFGKNRTLLAKAASGEGLFSFLARAETQGEHGLAETPIPVLNIKPTTEKPFLDSNLAEVCWQDSVEIRLTDDQTNGVAASPDCLVMLTWDEDYIYLAGRVEKSRRTGGIDPTAERYHDSKHATRDRIEFVFDVDRDYTTGFHFTVDDAGQTSERCWRKKNWNPEWHVASDADDKAWRFEAAIPQEELLSQNLRAGALWGVKIRRVVPGVREQFLMDPENPPSDPNANGYGMLRFIRNRKP